MRAGLVLAASSCRETLRSSGVQWTKRVSLVYPSAVPVFIGKIVDVARSETLVASKSKPGRMTPIVAVRVREENGSEATFNLTEETLPGAQVGDEILLTYRHPTGELLAAHSLRTAERAAKDLVDMLAQPLQNLARELAAGLAGLRERLGQKPDSEAHSASGEADPKAGG